MNIYKELLLDFLIKKNDISRAHTGLELFSIHDLSEPMTWSTLDCVTILSKLSDMGDKASCPWCIKYKSNCRLCGYADRHGVCDNFGSWYRKLRHKLPLDFSSIVKLQTQIAATKSKFNTILSRDWCTRLKLWFIQGGK